MLDQKTTRKGMFFRAGQCAALSSFRAEPRARFSARKIGLSPVIYY